MPTAATAANDELLQRLCPGWRLLLFGEPDDLHRYLLSRWPNSERRQQEPMRPAYPRLRAAAVLPTGQIPVSGPKPCCPTANVTTNGACCPGPVDPNNRGQCRALIPRHFSACAAGYTRTSDGTCCNNRYVSADRMSCNTPQWPCPSGEFRELGGACVPILAPVCPPGEVRNRRGVCVRVGPRACPPGQVRRRGECAPRILRHCPGGELRNARGVCVPFQPLRPCPRGEVRNARGGCVPFRPLRRPFGPGGFGHPYGPPLGPRMLR
jgi:hypothetical protein